MRLSFNEALSDKHMEFVELMELIVYNELEIIRGSKKENILLEKRFEDQIKELRIRNSIVKEMNDGWEINIINILRLMHKREQYLIDNLKNK